MSSLPLPLLLSGLLAAWPAVAHDLWVERQANRLVLQYGHERSGHGGVGLLAYSPAQVQRTACFDAQGRELAAVTSETYPVAMQPRTGDCAAGWFLLSSGYWSKTPYGTKNLPRSEVTGAVLSSWLSVESVKRLDAWGPGLGRPLTRELELVPQQNPLLLRPGDKLGLAVYRDGQPAPGVTVAYFGHPRGVTGADGRVNLRLKDAGYQLLQASLELPLANGKADRAVHATALVFELAP